MINIISLAVDCGFVFHFRTRSSNFVAHWIVRALLAPREYNCEYVPLVSVVKVILSRMYVV